MFVILQSFAGTIAATIAEMGHATLTDIAKRIGISPSTVSRALANHPDVKEETKAEVNRVAAELRYSANPIAQSLKNSRTMTIGVIVPEIKHDFFSSAISGIEDIAYNAGYTIIVCQSNESYEREVINTNALMNHRVAGVLVSISQNTKSSDHFHDLLSKRIPLVFFDRGRDDVEASKVVIDDYSCAYRAVTHLIQRGYKKIAHLAGPKELGICMKRQNGYVDALNDNHMPLRTGFVCYGGLHEPDGYNSMDTLLKGDDPPDAIFAVNDPVAIGAFQRIREAGLKIPADVAIVGFSNNKITALVEPPITTVNQPSFEMGKKAAEILIEQIEGRERTIRTVILDAELIERGST